MKEGIEIVAHCPDGVHPLDFSRALTKKILGERWAVGIAGPRNISADAARRMSKTQMENLLSAELASGKVKRLFLYPGEEAASKTAEDIFLYALCTHEGEWTKSQIDTLAIVFPR
jgi:hypothetical protein